MKILIHCTSIGGHQLEYIHHLYMGALETIDNEYVFVVPKRFGIDSKNLEWPNASNINIVYIEENKSKQIDGNILKQAFYKSKNLKEYIKKYSIDKVILIDLISYLPFIFLFVHKNVKIRGIIYKIYLYEWKCENIIKKTLDVIKYIIMRQFQIFEKVFILNDISAPSHLCKLYRTNKFCYLPDPVASLGSYQGINIREELGITSDKIVLLHPGGMLPYKGTLNILKAIDQMQPDECKRLVLITAGQSTPIQPEFNKLVDKIKNKIQIIHIEGFIPFEQLADLFSTCDFVIIPYLTKSQSSGIVGHAAYYEKPVIVARGGVIGKMVRKWKLGILLDEPSIYCIQEFLSKDIVAYQSKNTYCIDHSVEIFNKIIFN